MDILPDGSLDYDDDVLAQLDLLLLRYTKALTNLKQIS